MKRGPMNLEQTVGLLTLGVSVIAGLDFLIRWRFDNVTKALRIKVRHLEKENDRLRPSGDPPPSPPLVIELKEQLEKEQCRSRQLESRLATQSQLLEIAEAHVGNLKSQTFQLEADLATAKAWSATNTTQLEKHRRGVNSQKLIVKRTLALGGQIWVQDVLSGAPRFLPLPERRTPILSILNLKGGVGKTTLTAYLAWGLARRGYRVLLIDLDLQGSLSGLFLSGTELAEREHTDKLLRHFLEKAAVEPKTDLWDYATKAPRLREDVELLPTTDKLAYEELNLTFQWLFRIGKMNAQDEFQTESGAAPAVKWSGRKDVRLLLRRALHRASLKKRYDVVLLDCPPLINLCCVNALAASDYVLVPVTPSRKATERVPPLLQRLKEMKEKVNPDLNMLGILANRTQQADHLKGPDLDLWNGLPSACLDVFGTDVYRFETILPQRMAIRNAEDDFPPYEDQEMVERIDRLTREVESRLPHCCRPSLSAGPIQQTMDLTESDA